MIDWIYKSWDISDYGAKAVPQLVLKPKLKQVWVNTGIRVVCRRRDMQYYQTHHRTQFPRRRGVALLHDRLVDCDHLPVWHQYSLTHTLHTHIHTHGRDWCNCWVVSSDVSVNNTKNLKTKNSRSWLRPRLTITLFIKVIFNQI